MLKRLAALLVGAALCVPLAHAQNGLVGGPGAQIPNGGGSGAAVNLTGDVVSTGAATTYNNVVPSAKGGTGVNNGASTLTLGGNTTFAGAFPATLTSTATTNSTLPAGTHTLAGLDVNQTWTGQQIFNANFTGFGSATQVSLEQLLISFPSGSKQGAYFNDTSGGTAGTFIVFGRSGTAIGSINEASSTTVSYLTTSDGRLKDDRRRVANVRDKIAALNVYDFRWVGTDERGRGFIAQEARSVIPEAVHVGGDDVKTNPWQVDYSKAVPTLWANAQDTNSRIAILEREILKLKRAGRHARNNH